MQFKNRIWPAFQDFVMRNRIFFALTCLVYLLPSTGWSQGTRTASGGDLGEASPIQVAADIFLALQSENLPAIRSYFAPALYEILAANQSKLADQLQGLSLPRSRTILAKAFAEPRFFFELQFSHDSLRGDPRARAVVAAGGQSNIVIGYNPELGVIDALAFRLDFRVFEKNRPTPVFGNDVDDPIMVNAAAQLGEQAAARARTVDFLFATTRQWDQSSFNEKPATKTAFGAVRVSVPNDRKVGSIRLPRLVPGPGLLPYQEKLDPGKHFVILKLGVSPKPVWSDIVRAAKKTEALVFVHGFNNTFDDAVYRAAQVFWDLQYKGLPVVYSWPSWGNAVDPISLARSYDYDRDNALTDGDNFLEFLRLLRDQLGIKKVHILSHSMGNFLVLNALRRIQTDNGKFGEWILAAPDVDQRQFKQFVPGVQGFVSGMTLYASSADRVLRESMRVARGTPRAGYVDGKPLVLPGIDTIDVTSMGDELLGLNHDTFASNRSLIDDIGLLLDGVRPPNRRLRQIRPVPEDPPTEYWKFVP
ncbi:esterase/lipase superfamily enzyme [Bradyrhizobium sp. S3.2.6]|uniref:alpha/beta hydrolase n=1 Tax=Bradyrhizobium sp. S3.2.6 TaxID=3156428 RepID=UPI0033940621